MRREFNRLIGTAAALIVSSIAAHAQTPSAAAKSTPDCIVAATPAEVRASLIKHAPSLDLSAAMSQQQAMAVAEACHLPATGGDAQLIADTLRAKTLMVWSSRRLKSQYGVTEEGLLAGLHNLAPETRKDFSTAFSDGFRPTDKSYDDVAAMARGLKLDSEEPMLLVFDYVAGHAVWARLRKL